VSTVPAFGGVARLVAVVVFGAGHLWFGSGGVVFGATRDPVPPFTIDAPTGWSLARAAYRCGKPYWIWAPGTAEEHLAYERRPRERLAKYRLASLQIARGDCSASRGPRAQADFVVRMGQLKKKQFLASRDEREGDLRLRRNDGRRCMSHWVQPLLPVSALEMAAVYQEVPAESGQVKTFTHFLTFDGRTLWTIKYEGTGDRYDDNIDGIVACLQTLRFRPGAASGKPTSSTDPDPDPRHGTHSTGAGR